MFTYTICDDDTPATCATAAVTITVTDQGTPSATADTVVVASGGTATLAVLANDVLTDDARIAAVDTTGTAGTVVINPDGTIGYTPASGFAGSDAFTYTICDDDTPTPHCATATVTVDVTALLGAITGIVWWDVDADETHDSGEQLIGGVRILIVGAGADGVLGTADDVQQPAVYTGSPYFLGGLAAGRYRVSVDESTLPADLRTRTFDMNGALDAIATVTVAAGQTTTSVDFGYINLAPLATGNTAVTSEGQAVTIAVLPNDTDPEGRPLTIASVSHPLNGSVVINGDGTLTYTPRAGFDGTDTFTYTVCDPAGACAVATVVVTVTNTNEPPVAVTASSHVVASGQSWVPLVFADPTGPYTVGLLSGTLPSGMRLNSDGSFSGATSTPGTYVITVRACDPLAACADYVFSFTVGRRLPSTGAESQSLASIAILLVGLGAALLLIGRRRRRGWSGVG
jgi:LPXTG-motif cell wall-anchored protein